MMFPVLRWCTYFLWSHSDHLFPLTAITELIAHILIQRTNCAMILRDYHTPFAIKRVCIYHAVNGSRCAHKHLTRTPHCSVPNEMANAMVRTLTVTSLLFLLQTVHTFDLTILHNNDFHSRFAPTTIDSSPCNSNRTACIAGAARTAHMAEEIKRREENVIFLSAGDFFQGSLWYTQFKEPVISEFVPHMGYDAVCLGNHEFDDAAEGLYRYVDNMTAAGIPVLAANLDLSRIPKLQNVKRSAVLNVSGTQIGIIGYLTPDTRFLSSPDKEVIFSDETEAIRTEAALLKAKGIKILIALGHSGYAKDQEIALQVPDLDVVVGGHTNTFLWSPEFGEPPSVEKPLGKYPTVIRDGDRQTLVVQAFAYGKYMGRLQVHFDDDGNVISYGGRPILMDGTISEETSFGIKDRLLKYEEIILENYSAVVGRSAVFLDGGEHSCRMRECNMGNLVADAMVHAFVSKRPLHSKAWTQSAIAVNPGGTVRTSYDPKGGNGSITMGDVIAVLPFENELVTVNITGETLIEVMEHGVSAYDPSEHRLEGRFPQVSGIRVIYDASRDIGRRVTSLRVRCADCRFPKYEDVDVHRYYTVIMTDFMAKGGDGYEMLAECDVGCKQPFDLRPVDIVIDYLKERGIVTTGVEDRITVIGAKSAAPSIGAVSLYLALILQVTLHFFH